MNVSSAITGQRLCSRGHAAGGLRCSGLSCRQITCQPVLPARRRVNRGSIPFTAAADSRGCPAASVRAGKPAFGRQQPQGRVQDLSGCDDQRASTGHPQLLLQQGVAAVLAAAVAVAAVALPALLAPPRAYAVLNSPNAKIARSAEVNPAPTSK